MKTKKKADTRRDIILRVLYNDWRLSLPFFVCIVITIFVTIKEFFSTSIAINFTAPLIEFIAFLISYPLCQEEYSGGLVNTSFDGNFKDRNDKRIPFAKKISGFLICAGFLLWSMAAFV